MTTETTPEVKKPKKQPVLPLSTKQKQFLKGLAHSLSPLVQIGYEGVHDGIFALAKRELLAHELIKIKIGSNISLEKNETAAILAEKTGSHLVQLIGKTIVLYRENPKRKKEGRIRLPQ